MANLMLINATAADELRVAVVRDGELVDLDIETNEQSTLKGNIYKGVVHNVEGSLAAAFVDFGAKKQGFLPFDEIAASQYYREWKSKEPPRITDVIKRGQDIVVQIDKDPVGEKGAALTTHLSLAGRYTVLMPGSDARGVSRKIEDEKARKAIRQMSKDIEVPERCGYIIRTAGMGQEREAIQRDLDKLATRLVGLERAAGIARAPSVLHKEPDVIGRTLRDLFNDSIDEVWIDSKEEYEAAKEYFEDLMPDYADRVKWWQNPIPIFAYHHIEEQIEETFERRVALPSGGSIVIDRTEALVAIDVNSGKMTSQRDHEDTVYMTNYEAAQVIARQLRLRDLGGIIVVDFIDMELPRNRRAVVKAFENAAKSDKARIKVSRITSNGLCILTRQRIRQSIQKSFQQRCEACDGTGWIRTPESHSISLLRRIETRLAQGEVGEVRVVTHRRTAEHINNAKRADLLALEREFNVRILITSRPDMDRDKDHVTFLSKGEVLAERTDRMPSRDELRKRRSEGGGKTKRKRKNSAREAAESVRREATAAAEAAEAEVRGEQSDRRKKKRRRRDGEGDAPAPREARGEPRSETREPRPEASEPVGAQPEPAVPGGPTFTGRPSAEMLERAKAERRARMAARGHGRPKYLESAGPAALSPSEAVSEGPLDGDEDQTPTADLPTGDLAPQEASEAPAAEAMEAVAAVEPEEDATESIERTEAPAAEEDAEEAEPARPRRRRRRRTRAAEGGEADSETPAEVAAEAPASSDGESDPAEAEEEKPKRRRRRRTTRASEPAAAEAVEVAPEPAAAEAPAPEAGPELDADAELELVADDAVVDLDAAEASAPADPPMETDASVSQALDEAEAEDGPAVATAAAPEAEAAPQGRGLFARLLARARDAATDEES